jgi:3'(2'), 5'-bisphosphate nucleotidase
MAHHYQKELKAAELAVQRAALLTKNALKSVDRGSMEMEKSDQTPVTVADLGAQALIISALHGEFPDDGFLGEESATMLRESEDLSERVWKLVSSTRIEGSKLATPTSKDEMMDMIDRGGSGQGGRKGRVWVMDPVDGTSTFITGEQYVVCLCLLEDGEQKVGVLGCPNLSISEGKVSEKTVAKDGVGIMLSAVEGQGTFLRPLTFGPLGEPRRIQINADFPDLSKLQLVECVASSSMNQETHRRIAAKLGAQFPGTELWSQQMKYVALTVGGHDAMIRIPNTEWHRTCVWDHAGGHLIYEEAGGKVTDMNGKEIDFGTGRRCHDNIGNVAAPKEIHGRVLKVVKETLAEATS